MLLTEHHETFRPGLISKTAEFGHDSQLMGSRLAAYGGKLAAYGVTHNNSA